MAKAFLRGQFGINTVPAFQVDYILIVGKKVSWISRCLKMSHTTRDRNRARTRLRVGATYKIRDDLVFGTRIVTGNFDDPQSPHHTFGTTFNSLRLSLDRIFLKYSPQRAPGFWVTGGKFAHPFYANPVYGELVWDADVQPDGIAIGDGIQDKGRLERFDIVGGE